MPPESRIVVCTPRTVAKFDRSSVASIQTLVLGQSRRSISGTMQPERKIRSSALAGWMDEEMRSFVSRV